MPEEPGPAETPEQEPVAQAPSLDAEAPAEQASDASKPRWPDWAEDIRSTYQASAAVQFLIHGERDVVRFGDRWLPVREFLYRAFCAGKRVLYYDISGGITWPTEEDEEDFQRFAAIYSRRMGLKSTGIPSDPREAIPMIEEWLITRANAVAIIDYVEKFLPRKSAAYLSTDEKRLLITVRRWAVDPRILARNNCVFLLTDALAEVNEEVFETSSRVQVVEMPLPDASERLRYIEYLLELPDAEFPQATLGPGEEPPAIDLAMPAEVLAKITNGLSRMKIADCLRHARHTRTPVDHPLVTSWKKQSIEAELGELVEMVQPRFGLEALGGMDQQKELLLRTAAAMREGRTQVVPKGIMLLGPPGCGKTFSMSCFAHDCGIPFLRIKNIFSKYVGATEANLERLFHYLEALSPVFVFVDEFDQTYGRRVGSDSDSGVSRRVFAMFNAFLSDDAHQGEILFGAATNRPDLLDAATLRAGRFDLKLPYFLPDEETRREIFEVTFKNTRTQQTVESLDAAVARTGGYSGADLREIVITARRRAGLEGRGAVTQDDLDWAVADYIPPGKADPDTVRYMELLAVSLTTSRSLLKEEHVDLVDSGRLQEHLDELRTRIRLREL